MLITMLINLPMEDLLDGRRAVTFKGCIAIELVVKINARPPTVCSRMDDILSPSVIQLK
jgi:hypothetical protein